MRCDSPHERPYRSADERDAGRAALLLALLVCGAACRTPARPAAAADALLASATKSAIRSNSGNTKDPAIREADPLSLIVR